MFIKLVKTDRTPLLLNASEIISVGVSHYNNGNSDVKVSTEVETYNVQNTFEEIEKKLGVFLKLVKTDNTPVLLNKSKVRSVGITHYVRGGFDTKVSTNIQTYAVKNSFEEIEQKLTT